jgi:hypothetical protein
MVGFALVEDIVDFLSEQEFLETVLDPPASYTDGGFLAPPGFAIVQTSAF